MGAAFFDGIRARRHPFGRPLEMSASVVMPRALLQSTRKTVIPVQLVHRSKQTDQVFLRDIDAKPITQCTVN